MEGIHEVKLGTQTFTVKECFEQNRRFTMEAIGLIGPQPFTTEQWGAGSIGFGDPTPVPIVAYSGLDQPDMIQYRVRLLGDPDWGAWTDLTGYPASFPEVFFTEVLASGDYDIQIRAQVGASFSPESDTKDFTVT